MRHPEDPSDVTDHDNCNCDQALALVDTVNRLVKERDEARRLAEHWRKTQSRVHGSLDRMTLCLSEEMVQRIESGGDGSAGEKERLQNARMNIEEFRRKAGDERFPWENEE